MDHMERYRLRAADLRREEYRGEAMLKVNQEWSEAISPDIVVPPSTQTAVVEPSNRAEITSKLQSIIIDKINFQKLDVASVVQFLNEKSKELDPQHVGINFVLNLNQETPPARQCRAPAPGNANPPGAGGDNTAAPTPPPGPIHREVTIELDRMSRFPTCWATSSSRPTSSIRWTITPSTCAPPSTRARRSPCAPSWRRPISSPAPAACSVSASTRRLRCQPLTVEERHRTTSPRASSRTAASAFPPGATAVFLPGSSKLVVRNTPEQLDLIANLIEQESKPTPQVQIEAKLAEFTEDALKSLSFNYLIGTRHLLQGSPLSSGGFDFATGLRDANYTPGTSTLGAATTGG